MNPGYFKQQETMSDFTNWLRSQAAPSTVQTLEKEEKKEIVEEKKEVFFLILTKIRKNSMILNYLRLIRRKKLFLLKKLEHY